MRFDVAGVNKLFIFTEEVFKIHLETSKTDQIILTSHSAGEYYNEINLKMEVLKDKMILTSEFREILRGGYDKLSAHKVFSMEITLKIPEKMEVFINSNIASVFATGNYTYLEVELKAGLCELKDFSGNALVNTYSGAINIETTNANISASTRQGEVYLSDNNPGKYKVELHSITGDIMVREN